VRVENYEDMSFSAEAFLPVVCYIYSASKIGIRQTPIFNQFLHCVVFIFDAHLREGDSLTFLLLKFQACFLITYRLYMCVWSYSVLSRFSRRLK